MKTAVVIMSKIPLPGYTKTRMMPEMTAAECADFHKACLADICRTVKKTSYTGFLYYVGQNMDQVTPDDKNLTGLDEDTLRYFRIKAQRGNNLGQRMLEAVREVLVDFDAVIVIGSDIPELHSLLLQETVKRLQYFDVVLGPAIDGGYYLVAMTRPDREIFTDVPWGTGNVLHITLEKLKKENKTFFLLPQLHDIDTWEDIKRYCRREKNGGRDNRCLSSWQLAKQLVEAKNITCSGVNGKPQVSGL
ncbi:MAG: glycosyl transferase [Firmicutes bacterium]|nr:glycosyl transferase [Bacillota bacterium]